MAVVAPEPEEGKCVTDGRKIPKFAENGWILPFLQRLSLLWVNAPISPSSATTDNRFKN